MKPDTDGRGYSREKLLEFDTLEIVADFLQQHYVQHPSMPRWRRLAAAARHLAATYLTSHGLPSQGFMFQHKASGKWSAKPPAWWRRTDPEGMEPFVGGSAVPFDRFIQQRYRRDSLPDLAVRLLTTTAAMHYAADRGNVDMLAHWCIELGKTMALFQVYTVAAAGSRRKSRAKPWTAYAQHLIAQHPGLTKDAIWRLIPVDGEQDGAIVANWQVTRNDADDGLIAYDSTGDPATLKRDQFFRRYLHTRRKHRK